MYIYNSSSILSFYCPQTSFIHCNKAELLGVAPLLDRHDYMQVGGLNPLPAFEEYLEGDGRPITQTQKGLLSAAINTDPAESGPKPKIMVVEEDLEKKFERKREDEGGEDVLLHLGMESGTESSVV